MQEEKKVILIGEQKNYMLLSIKEQLEQNEISTVPVPASMEILSRIKGNVRGLIIYAEEKMLDDQRLMVYLKDRITQEEWPVFIIGYSEELAGLKRAIPGQYIQAEFMRPLNVREMVSIIKNYYENNYAERRKKILVVDDSGTTLRSIKEWLEVSYDVVLANSGMMAIKYLTMDKPDLVLLDYEMPVCDGKQVLEMIRSEIDFADIPVIFLTSRGDTESVMNVMALRPNGYLLKTMEPDMILKSIGDFFQKQKAKNQKIG